MTDADESAPEPAEKRGDDAAGSDGRTGTGADEAVRERIGLAEARRTALDLAADVLEYDVDGVIKVEPADDGWRVLVEVVEREAVPDTNDILGRYELSLSGTGELTEFGLVERYRRDELKEEL